MNPLIDAQHSFNIKLLLHLAEIALKLISKFPDIARGNYEGVATPMETIASSFDIYNRQFISDKLFDHGIYLFLVILQCSLDFI